MEPATGAITQDPFFHTHDDVAAPPDDWSELQGGCSPATRKWLFFRRKYLLERAIGTLLLVIAAPVILLLIAVVRLTSPGPGIYRQLRVGYRGKPFYILKIRSMVRDAEKDGRPVWCKKKDSRVTRVGAFLRKVHLDELPQLVNVARGEMALVGPRPERPEIIKNLRRQIPGYEQRLSVMPGVTGLAQINLPPDETIDDVRRKQYLDLKYIREASFWLDFRMLLGTCMRMVGIPGAVVMSGLSLTRPIPKDLCLPAAPAEETEAAAEQHEREKAYSEALAKV